MKVICQDCGSEYQILPADLQKTKETICPECRKNLLIGRNLQLAPVLQDEQLAEFVFETPGEIENTVKEMQEQLEANQVVVPLEDISDMINTAKIINGQGDFSSLPSNYASEPLPEENNTLGKVVAKSKKRRK